MGSTSTRRPLGELPSVWGQVPGAGGFAWALANRMPIDGSLLTQLQLSDFHYHQPVLTWNDTSREQAH